jgi:branched-chain amino acid transport system ATP-binding protein
MFAVDNVTKRFAGLLAVDAVSFAVDAGVVTAVIGPNGAGKSTLFNMMAGALRPSSGRILLEGADVTNWSPEARVRAGVARTFQNIRLFRNLNVLENVLVGRYSRDHTTFGESALFLPRHRKETRRNKERVLELLDLVGIADRRLALPDELSYGDQRRVEIARALAAEPRILMLDEPSAGMIEREADQVMDLLRRLCAEGRTVFLIEHNMRVVMSLSAKVIVINFGKKLAEGAPSEIQENPDVLEAYLGVDE